MTSLTMMNNASKFSGNKITATAIATLLLLSIVGALASVPSASALSPNSPRLIYWHEFSYCSVGSNVVGLGQQILLVLWTADIPPDIGELDGLVANPYHRAAWEGQQFNVTDPDGITETINLGYSDSVGGGYYAYTPEKVGTYTVISIFPDTWKNDTIVTLPNGTQTVGPHTGSSGAGSGGVYNVNPDLVVARTQFFSAAVSNPVTFVVQEEPVPLWTESPLPNDYWTRPINNAARLWSALPGNWLESSYSGGPWQQPMGAAGGTTTRFVYGVGTETSHILWTRPQYVGGYMDARFGDIGYMTDHYTGLDFTSIILNGRIFAPARMDAYGNQGFNVYDLYTGDLMMFINETMPSYGQIYNYISPNQHGGVSMLWRSVSGLGSGNGTSLEMLDGYALPLRHIVTICNASTSGTQVIGNNGERLWYNLVNYGTTANPQYYLTCWNNTNVLGLTGAPPGSGTSYWQWRPEGATINNARFLDGSTGFSFNVSIPTPYGARNSVVNQTGTIYCVRVGTDNAPGTGFSDNVGGYVIIGTPGSNTEQGVVQGQLWALSLDRGQEGTQLWTSSFTPPFMSIDRNETLAAMGSGFTIVGVYPEDGVIIFHSTRLLTYWGYDMKTGQQLWQSPPEPDNNYYSTQYNYYQGNLLTSGYGGVVIAYNITTGEQSWNFTATNVGLESPYGNYPINIFAVCDGKIYTLAGEHSITNPLWRGPNIRCINATDGSEIWNLLGMGADGGAHLTGQYMQMADGKVVGLNYMDNEIYCIGPGPSATTVSAPQTVPALGSSVAIIGTVTDQTPTGRFNDNYGLDFALKGTPAIADDSMGRWMEYLFENQIMPSNATGVPVTLTAIDPNSNFIHIGDVTSDVHGNYGLKFTPEVPGTYQILATFAGSKAYGPSSESTYLVVGEAPASSSAATAQPLQQSVADVYFIPVAVGLFIFVAIIGGAIILMLRKRP